MAQMQAMEARLERAATPARERCESEAREPAGPGPAASLAPDRAELRRPNSGPEQTETPMDSGLGSQMHSPVVAPGTPASASGTRAESPAALPPRCARAVRGGADSRGRILESARDARKRPPETSPRDLQSESLFRDKTSPSREASVGGFSRRRARLHTAGADAALPPDVRLALRASAGGAYAQTVSEHSAYAFAPRAPSRLDINAELEDVRDVNDVVVQFLAYRSFPSAASRLAERRGGARSGPTDRRVLIRAAATSPRRRRAHDGRPRDGSTRLSARAPSLAGQRPVHVRLFRFPDGHQPRVRPDRGDGARASRG